MMISHCNTCNGEGESLLNKKIKKIDKFLEIFIDKGTKNNHKIYKRRVFLMFFSLGYQVNTFLFLHLLN